MTDCPNFKLAWNGTCAHLIDDYDEEGHYIEYCKYNGEQIKLIEECEMKGE